MASVDHALESVLTALVQGLRELNIEFCIIGALVPQLLLETKPDVRTNDADAVLFVSDIGAFEAVKKAMVLKGFSETKTPHRLAYREGELVDIIPYSRELAPDGTLRLPPDLLMNMTGFDHVVGAAVDVTLDSGLVVPVTPLSLYAILKLIAYTDRKAAKDVDAVEHVLRHYGEGDDRRWGLEHAGKLVDYDYGPAYLLGIDGAKFVGSEESATLRPILVALSEGSDGLPVGENGDDAWKPSRADLFLRYQLGLGL